MAPKIEGLNFPLAVKMISRDMAHKSDFGAVRVDVKNELHLAQCIAEMTALIDAKYPNVKIEGILVQEMQFGVAELLVGFYRDPVVGPCVTVAGGGIWAEVYNDISVRPAPISLETAYEMVAEVKALKMLDGFRGHPEGDVEALAQAHTAHLAILRHIRRLKKQK